MKRTVAVYLVAAASLVGLTACTINIPVPQAETSAEKTTPAPTKQETSQPTEQDPDASPSIVSCMDISNELMVAYAEMAEIAETSDSSDMQATVDMYTSLVDALGSLAATTDDADLAAAAIAAQTDLAAVRDGLKRVYIDDDITGLSELTEASLAFQTSYLSLFEQCGGASTGGVDLQSLKDLMSESGDLMSEATDYMKQLESLSDSLNQ